MIEEVHRLRALRARRVIGRAAELRALALIAVAGSAACSGDFDPYGKLLNFRVLAIRAAPPDLKPGAVAHLDALTFQPEASPPPISYAWSWCPLRGGAEQDFDCFFTREQLQAEIDARLGAGLIQVPPFDLGTTATATFAYQLPPQVFRAFCAALSGIAIPTTIGVPACGSTYPISVRLDATAGGQRIAVLKQIDLQVGTSTPAAVNENPEITGVSYALARTTTTGTIAATARIDEHDPPRLRHDTAYRLELDIPETAAETYLGPSATSSTTLVPLRETLAVTWFYPAGSMDRARTGFIQGEEPLDVTRRNTWTTPKKADFPDGRARLFFVIRDNREGVAWLERDVILED